MEDTERVQIMMPKKMIENLDKLAVIEFETRSNLVRRAVNKYISEFNFTKEK